MNYSLVANVVNITAKKIFKGEINFCNGKIISIKVLDEIEDPSLNYAIPGFVDAHVHIESSMLVPSEFAKLAVIHGTVATVSDPHEIANVCGIKGVEYMIENGNTVPFKFFFGAPSCVPATGFETSGAQINADGVKELLNRADIFYLSEMMNYPGVLNDDCQIMEKLQAAKTSGKPVDGHAPGLSGDGLKKYINAGISTDHECSTKEEALEKLSYGMKILIREGSAAKNFDALIDLLNDHSDKIMFCSDDKHPDSLAEGHINKLCQRAAKLGIDKFKILKAACINPVKHFNLTVGLLEINDAADFILVNNLFEFNIIKTYINGELVADNGRSLINSHPPEIINNFTCNLKTVKEFELDHLSTYASIIEALDGQLLTNKIIRLLPNFNDRIFPDTENDILKLVVVNRYEDQKPAIAFVKNFGLTSGAIASSVAHDSHNIIAVGVDDDTICNAVNLIISYKGGISLDPGLSCEKDGNKKIILPLPVAGLMSDEDGLKVAGKYTEIDLAAKKLGSKLSSPFMTLSFLALLVIPHLKLSDKGLFDVDKFEFVK